MFAQEFGYTGAEFRALGYRDFELLRRHLKRKSQGA